MAEADVTYVDVKFTKKAKDEVPAADVVYSTVRRPQIQEQVCATCAANVQPVGQSMKSKVTLKLVVLLVLFAILVVTIICLAAKMNPSTKMDAGNSTHTCPPPKPLTCPPPPTCTKSTDGPKPPTCPPPPAVKNLTCLKCEAGWEQHGGTCYYFSTSKSSWNESRRSCRDLGGDLVKIDSREEQMFLLKRLRDLMEDTKIDKFWIGLSDSKEEGRWFWLDGSALDESLVFWNDGEPDSKSFNGAPEADCVRMGEKGGADDLKSWFDISCEYPQRSVCEKAAEPRLCSCV